MTKKRLAVMDCDNCGRKQVPKNGEWHWVPGYSPSMDSHRFCNFEEVVQRLRMSEPAFPYLWVEPDRINTNDTRLHP